MTFGLPPPKNVTNLFGNWLDGLSKKNVVRLNVCIGRLGIVLA
jgi:hypothetical protein